MSFVGNNKIEGFYADKIIFQNVRSTAKNIKTVDKTLKL